LPNEEDKIGRFSSSPDFVVLIGLRNPSNVPTSIAPLADILPILSEPALAELQKKQFLVGTQATFKIDHQLVDVPIISIDREFGYQIRFSHSRVSVPDENDAGKKALEELKSAVEKSLKDLIIEPGDVLLINNRTALHGRRKVGGGIGGTSRWIQRTYANRKTTPTIPVDEKIPFRLRP
jgi:L-asparagine oxygenase